MPLIFSLALAAREQDMKQIVVKSKNDEIVIDLPPRWEPPPKRKIVVSKQPVQLLAKWVESDSTLPYEEWREQQIAAHWARQTR